ncbi:sensor histidine kinase [bacterium 1xD8-48]|nr:sensor histidine kinase [bacterium 1xD8-48]
MNNVQRFFKRYVYSSVRLFCFFIFVNIALFIALTVISGSQGSHSPTQLLEAITEDLQQSASSYVLSDNTIAKMEQENVWCMMISNESGNVLWNYKLPSELPQHYTAGDVAEMTRWYLQEYPVFVSNQSDELLVIGYPKDSFWKISAYKTFESIKIDILGLVSLFLLNIVIVLILFVHNSRKVEKSIKPILTGIEEISAGKNTQLVEHGELAEINTKLNKVAITLQQRDMARANWISGISHDIRTPLSMVLGYSSSLETDNTLNAEQQEKVAAIRQQAAKIKYLIEDLNLTAKLEYDMQPLRVEKIHLVELARQVVCEFLDSNLDNSFSIDFITDSDSELLYINGDETLLKRAITNLIQNSIGHNPSGCEITVSVSCNNQNATVIIADNGIGIPAQKLKELNSKTHYMESTDEKLNLRHGLGMLLVRQIVDAHHGVIKIESKPQEGFKTTLTFPQ